MREVPVVEIPLEGDLADAKAEISGLTWCGDHLILIPQYPARFAPKDKSYFYTLTKAEILDSLAQNPLRALKPSPVELDDGEASQLPGYEGFEAAACFGEHFYAAVETKSGDRMMGYLFVGKVNEALTEIKLDKGSRKELPPQAKIDNFTNEALAWTGEGILSFYEANGAKVNPDAHALVFDRQFNPQKNAPMPSLEYRLTDATPVDEAGNFWVINYFYPGDTKIKPDSDPLALNGEGASHQVSENVERLVQLHWDGEKISLGEHAPIWLQLRDNGEARNWEGLAQLDDKGFLLVTDTHPRTILGFVKANP
ncbi:MAG TPA: hypothetical protein PKW33_06145 [Anaerolineaceae bacterium]|nr:hypothetical protein [Anaerolineaceae bacterium]HPN51149.1 hypothetical protein [Anaerolineaceae bacterium]